MKQSSAFRSIATASIMTATLLGGTAVISSTPQMAWAQAAPNVTVDARDAPLRDVLEKVFRAAKVDFSIDPTVVGRVTLTMKEIPFEDALKLILRSSSTKFTYTSERGVYLVKPGTLPAEPLVKPVTAPAVTLDMKNVAFLAGLEQIFRTAKVDYSIDPAIMSDASLKQQYVTLKSTNAPFENTLKALLR
ncbi:MAG: hypothetical protein H8F28_25280, partial [Fibrella sp.]|nr:hypothetical protein [Armatimonadota bacterium]